MVTDADGKTLYRFDKDLSQPPTSNCDAECAAAWPPALAGAGTPMLKGIQDTQVGTLTRKDGSKQLTLNGWPLYEFAGDKDSGPGERPGRQRHLVRGGPGRQQDHRGRPGAARGRWLRVLSTDGFPGRTRKDGSR